MGNMCDAQGQKLKVEYSEDAETWDDGTATWAEVTGVSGMLDPTGGDKTVSEYRTFGRIVAATNRPGVQNIALEVLFENDTTSFLEFLTDTFDGTKPECFFLRWAYNEGAAGALRRTAQVKLLTNPFTGGNANSSDPLRKSLTLSTTEIHRDVVPTPP